MTKGPAPCRGRRGRFVSAAALLLLGVQAQPGAAHDLWILAGKYRLAPAETTRVFVNSGDTFPESLTLVGAHRVDELLVRGPGWPDGEERITEFRVDGESLTFDLAPPAIGSHVLGLATRPRTVRLKPEDFEDYLAEEKLTDMAELRKEAGESGEAAVERYTKWAKTVVEVEGEPDDEDSNPLWREPLGHRIEIVPLRDPNGLFADDELPFQVLFEGQALAAARVSSGRAGGGEAVEVETDAGGEASVSLPFPGRWYLRTIHMVRSEEDPQVRWESFWCTLTFEVRERSGETKR